MLSINVARCRRLLWGVSQSIECRRRLWNMAPASPNRSNWSASNTKSWSLVLFNNLALKILFFFLFLHFYAGFSVRLRCTSSVLTDAYPCHFVSSLFTVIRWRSHNERYFHFVRLFFFVLILFLRDARKSRDWNGSARPLPFYRLSFPW